MRVAPASSDIARAIRPHVRNRSPERKEISMAGTWTALQNQPTFAASTMLLLTDGTVMCQEAGGVRWWKLTPDAYGSYVHGTWAPLAPMLNTRLYYASAVLADGRVIVAGGEYSDAGSETNRCEIYDPIADAWSAVPPPPGWAHIGDGSSALLPDGRWLIGNAYDQRTAIYDPIAGTWGVGAPMKQRSNEETWVLLPDETVLAPQCFGHPGSEKLVLAANVWVDAGAIPGDLVEDSSKEIGPGVLLTDGRAFFVGSTGRSALYTPPPIASQRGTWAPGPMLPKDAHGKQLGAKDAPGCLLTNGHVLCAVAPVDGTANFWGSPTSFFEFDGATFVRVADPPNAGGVPYVGRMLLLPTGEVAYAAGTNAVYLYQSTGGPEFAWRPAITAAPSTVRAGASYSLHGRQLNGLSQAVSYGDDAMAATNYPLVRLRHVASGKITFCRTRDHDSMGVATGTAVHATHFTVPCSAPAGTSELCVIANGIESPSVSVTVRAFIWRMPFDLPLTDVVVNHLIGSLADGPLFVLGPNGPIPVDPWGPFAAKQADAARKQVLAGLRTMLELGAQVDRNRTKIAAAIPPAVEDEDGDEGKEKTKVAARAKRRTTVATSVS
jgi:Kelch motif protein